MKSETSLELGLGLIGIGREWPVGSGKLIPPNSEVQELLQFAYRSGIRFFDTASAYGLSQKRLGEFLRGLSSADLSKLTVATKFGEHFDPSTAHLRNGSPTFSDHSFDKLRESLDNSRKLLPKIDLLQVHQASKEVLESPDIYKAIDYAKSLGINHFGASVKSLDAAEIACELTIFDYLQLPFNQDNQVLAPIFGLARKNGKFLIINRPFNTGKILSSPFHFILEQDFSGVVLTGTTSKVHLTENKQAFDQALKEREGKNV